MHGIWVKQNGSLLEANVKTMLGTCCCEWETPYGVVTLYNLGGADMNRYDFPPPVDNEVYYGDCFLTAIDHVLTIEEWTTYYESVMDSINIEHSEGEEEEDDDPNLVLTKHGYEKDGFVVSDDELDEVEYN
jgi:hypothetical protein